MISKADRKLLNDKGITDKTIRILGLESTPRGFMFRAQTYDTKRYHWIEIDRDGKYLNYPEGYSGIYAEGSRIWIV